MSLATLDVSHSGPISSSTPRSFRDPAGVVYRDGDRIVRSVHSQHVEELEYFLGTEAARSAIARGDLVTTNKLSPGLYQHERITFPSYPYEWSPEMLYATGQLTLRLFFEALEHGYGLKDATPYNVLFRGPKPVFVDVLSFEKRQPLDSTWLSYAQFVRTFLLPLLAAKDFGLPLAQTLGTQRDGLEPENIYRWAGWTARFSKPYLSLVSIPRWLGAKAEGQSGNASLYAGKPSGSSEQADFVLKGLLRGCAKHLEAVQPKAVKDSTWSGYLDHKSLYSPAQLAQKERFVQSALDLVKPRSVLDVGANEGHFSFLSARRGAEVVAIDYDPAVVGSIYQKAATEKLNVLPLVVDLTRPTPALGWRNNECASFLDRSRGHFDLVLMLAVIHHMLVTERVPLEEILDLAAELTQGWVLIEFVAPQDPMFQRIVRGRGHLHSHMTNAWFEAAAASRFEFVLTEQLEGLDRCLYLLRRRG